MLVKDFIVLVAYLLVPLACNFTKRWASHKSRSLHCQKHSSDSLWLVNRTNLLVKQNILFAYNGDWKKSFASELCQLLWLTFIEWRCTLKLVSAIFYHIFISHQMIALQKLWKMLFISCEKLFSFSRYSNFFISTFPSFSPWQPLL